MGVFRDMANGTEAHEHEKRPVFSVSKRRSAGTVFLQPQTGRRAAHRQIPGIPTADPSNLGALYRDTNNFLKVSEG